MYQPLPFALLLALTIASAAQAQEATELAELEALVNEAVDEADQKEAADRSFGERQLAQLLDDRPEMKQVLPEQHPIWQWVVEKFSTGSFGERVYWDSREPFSGSQAEHQPAYEKFLPCIRITADQQVTGRDKWYMLVFEMENMQNATGFADLTKLVGMDLVDREQFARKCVELEFQASLRTQKFLLQLPLPEATHENAPSYFQLIAMDDDFPAYMDWLETLDEGQYNPREYFAAYFDELEAYRQRLTQQEDPASQQVVERGDPPTRHQRRITIEGGTTIVKGSKIKNKGGRTTIEENP